MAGKHQHLGVAEFHDLAIAWPILRDTLGHAALRQPRSAAMRTLAAVARNRPTWELAVTSAAYSHLKAPKILAGASYPVLVVIADALTSLPGRARLPEFPDLARDISTLPWRTLIRGAPRLAATLHHDQPLLTAATFECTYYCMQKFRKGSPEFIKCLQDCNE
jgi:hypothetical protein